MKLFNQFRAILLMDEAGGDGGAGGGGAAAPSLLGGAGGGGDSTGGGGTGDSSGGAAGGKADASGAKSTQGSSASDWRSTLPKELQDDPTIKKFPTVDALAKSYLSAQGMIGADKIVVPNAKTATADDWENVFNKLGRPALDKYEVKFKDGVTIDKDFHEAFRTTAHKTGLLPSQAQGLADWFSDINAQAEQKFVAQRQANFDKQVNDLKTEWGNAFDAKIGRVNKLISDMGAAKYFQERGYGSDPILFKFLDFAADKLYKDAKIIDGSNAGGGKAARTPQEIRAAIGKLQADPAYNSKDHPAHAAAVQEMQGLHEELYPVDKKK